MSSIETTQKIKEYDQQENQAGGQINSTHRPSLNAFPKEGDHTTAIQHNSSFRNASKYRK